MPRSIFARWHSVERVAELYWDMLCAHSQSCLIFCCVRGSVGGVAAAARRSRSSTCALPMRDGVQLVDQHFPARREARVPAILVRTPYGKGDDIRPLTSLSSSAATPSWWRTCAAATNRRACSSRSSRKATDGYDTIDWIARQPWSDGKVGMMGGSYLGIVQWKAALLNNPHLKAIFPGGLGLRRLPRPLLFARRRHEARQPPELDVPTTCARPASSAGFQPLHLAPAAAHGRPGRHRADLRHVPGGHRSSGVRFVLEIDQHARAAGARCKVPVVLVRAAGTTISWRATWRPTRRCARTPTVNRIADRAVAAQHVVQVSERGFRAGFLGGRCARCSWMVRSLAERRRTRRCFRSRRCGSS